MQPLVRNGGVSGLQIDRRCVDARPERAAFGGGGYARFRFTVATGATDRIVPCRRAKGRPGGLSISSYSPINARSATESKTATQQAQCDGAWSSKASGVSQSLRERPSCPGSAPPGFECSRLSLRSVEGGFEEVREVLSGRCHPQHQIGQFLLAKAFQIRAIYPYVESPSKLACKGRR